VTTARPGGACACPIPRAGSPGWSWRRQKLPVPGRHLRHGRLAVLAWPGVEFEGLDEQLLSEGGGGVHLLPEKAQVVGVLHAQNGLGDLGPLLAELFGELLVAS